MSDIAFYHLLDQPLDQALPRLLERVIQAGFRALVRVGSEDQLDRLDKALWIYDKASFLPHGTDESEYADKQPIYLSTRGDNPNNATVLVLLDGIVPMNYGTFARCLYMFEGTAATNLATARQHWREFKAEGHNMTYWKQNADRGWDKVVMAERS